MTTKTQQTGSATSILTTIISIVVVIVLARACGSVVGREAAEKNFKERQNEEKIQTASNTKTQLDDVRSAADNGDAESQCSIANRYYRGDGVPQDYSEARKWYELAAAQGNSEALYKLGVIYKTGEGGIEDKQKSLKYYTEASKKGHAKAQLELGKWYYVGYSGLKDYVTAYMFFNLAAANTKRDQVMILTGTPIEADEWKSILEEVMTSDEIAKAQSLSTKWSRDYSKGSH